LTIGCAPKPQQFLQRGARVEIATPVAQVVMGEQHLRDRRIEQGLPEAHQRGLPERGQGLPLDDAIAGRADAPATCGNGTGRDQDDFSAL
jgi:hypothetical protein